jgi:hypothetical protein
LADLWHSVWAAQIPMLVDDGRNSDNSCNVRFLEQRLASSTAKMGALQSAPNLVNDCFFSIAAHVKPPGYIVSSFYVPESYG